MLNSIILYSSPKLGYGKIKKFTIFPIENIGNQAVNNLTLMSGKSKYNILYVDDEYNNLVVFESAFFTNYNILTAISGREALKIIRENEIHLIITDQKMPVMTGIELLEEISPEFPDIPSMIITAYSDIDFIIPAINKCGIFSYILKPWDSRDLKITIDNALAKYQLNKDNKLLLENLRKANEDLELKVSDRTVELNKTNKELLAINSLKDKLFTVISHDLRQPVLSFEVLLETIRSYKDKLTREKFEVLTTAIQSQLTEVKDLMDNLLNWAMVQMQYHELNKQDFDLKNSLKRNLELYREQANEKRIKLSLHENKGNEYVNGDENMYDVVLRNLLSNAVKFTDKNGKIDCSIDHTKSYIVVSIKDNGRGIPKETKEKLFKNMEMITTRGTAKEKGIGIGLKLCKEFVEMQGGKLSLESEVGEGSIFSFTVPK